MLKQNFRAVDKYGTYLFKSLPLDQWHPPMDVFEIAANWLLNFGFETSESAMARTIFSRLNWNFDKRTNELFLPHKIHIRMACLIVEVSSKHVPETIGLSGISESVRQVSSLMKGQSPQQQFSTWCWNMVAVLRLHCFDQSSEFIRRAIRSPQDALRHVSEIERLLAIAAGVVDNRPLAVYLSILSTLWGHSVPQICHKVHAIAFTISCFFVFQPEANCLSFQSTGIQPNASIAPGLSSFGRASMSATGHAIFPRVSGQSEQMYGIPNDTGSNTIGRSYIHSHGEGFYQQ